jgi:hypothetical protein
VAFAVIMDSSGPTLDDCDRVLERMGLTPGGSAPPGCLFVWVTATDDGIRVTDVRADAEAFERSSAEQIGPVTQELGLPAPSSVTTHEAHDRLMPGQVGSAPRPARVAGARRGRGPRRPR